MLLFKEIAAEVLQDYWRTKKTLRGIPASEGKLTIKTGSKEIDARRIANVTDNNAMIYTITALSQFSSSAHRGGFRYTQHYAERLPVGDGRVDGKPLMRLGDNAYGPGARPAEFGCALGLQAPLVPDQGQDVAGNFPASKRVFAFHTAVGSFTRPKARIRAAGPLPVPTRIGAPDGKHGGAVWSCAHRHRGNAVGDRAHITTGPDDSKPRLPYADVVQTTSMEKFNVGIFIRDEHYARPFCSNAFPNWNAGGARDVREKLFCSWTG